MNILRYSSDVEESQLRHAIVETGRIGYAKGFLTANNGNISGRLEDGTIVISPSGLCKGRMSEDDLFRLQPDGTVVASPPDESLSVSSETPMHLAALRIRSDRRACLHAHPTFCIALSVADRPLLPLMVPEVAVVLGNIPTSDFGLPSSDDDVRIIQDLVAEHDALILRNHGSLTLGRHLDEALIHLERMEHAAEVQVLASLMGEVNLYPPSMYPQLAALRRRMFPNAGRAGTGP